MDGVPALRSPSLSRDGAALRERVVASGLDRIKAALAPFPENRAPSRIRGIDALRPLFARGGAIDRLAEGVPDPGTRAVRAVLSDKTAATNWSLAWHQDGTVCVRARIDVPGHGDRGR